MMNLYILINGLNGGGAERVVADLSKSLPHNISTTIITLIDTEDKYSVDVARKALHLPHKRFPFIFEIPLDIFIGFIKYLILLRISKPDVSFSLLEPANIINILACHFTNTTAIVSLRNNPYSPYLSKIERYYNRLLIHLSKKYAKCVLTNSEEIRLRLISENHYSPEQVRCIYNPKDIVSIQQKMVIVDNNDLSLIKVPIIITVGRLDSQKGQWHLLRVFAALRKHILCKLVICGDGELRALLEKLAIDLGVASDVLFLGWCENPYKYIANSDIFVLSSLYEGQPNVLIEAMICGCPVVSSDCDYGPREVLNGGKYGMLSLKLDSGEFNAVDVLSDAEEDMRDKIQLLLTDLKLRDNYHRLSLERGGYFDREKIMKDYEKLFEECL